MFEMDGVNASFIQRANAMEESFEAAVVLIAQAYGKAVESRLIKLLKLVDAVPGNPYRSARVRAALRDFFAEVEALDVKLFGPGSVFESQTQRVMASMARLGEEKLLAQFQAQRFVLKQTLLSADMIKAAAVDIYMLAAKNLSSVDFLRQKITTELIQGNGVPALTRALAEAHIIQDGQKVPMIQDLVRGPRVYRAEQRAKMMARTEPRRLLETGYQASTEEVEPDAAQRLFRWVSVLAPTSTRDSLDRHGHIMTKEEWDTHTWPNDSYMGTPPLRPNDRCSVIFYKLAWLNDEARQALKAPAGDEQRRILMPGQAQALGDLVAA